MKTRPYILAVDTSPGWGGALTSLVTLCSELDRAGLRVAIASRASARLSEQVPNVRNLALPEDDPGAIYGRRFALRELQRARMLVDACAQLQPRAILANNTPSANLAAHICGRVYGIPVIQYVRAGFVATKTTRVLARTTDQTFAVGRAAARTLDSIGARYTPIAEALDRNAWPTLRGRAADGVLWCAALARWKGLDLALSAYDALDYADRPKLEICYAPLDERHPDADCLPSHLPPGAFLNCQSTRLDSLRASCNIFLHSSLAGEPFGRSLLESMAAGLCPLVPDYADSAPLVQHEQTGLLYAGGNRESLTQQLRRLTREPHLAAQLGAAARVQALAYTSDRVFEPIVKTLVRIASAQTVQVTHSSNVLGRLPWRFEH